jgi:hypothetical protein
VDISPMDRQLRTQLAVACARKGDAVMATSIWRDLVEKHQQIGFLLAVFDQFDSWEHRIAWLKQLVTFPHDSWYQREVNRILTGNPSPLSEIRRMYSELDRTYLFEKMWGEILRVLETCRVLYQNMIMDQIGETHVPRVAEMSEGFMFAPFLIFPDCVLRWLLRLKHPLQAVIMHITNSTTSAALINFEAYKEEVEPLRKQHDPLSDPGHRLSFLQLIAKVTAAEELGGESDLMWSCLMKFVQQRMKPLVDELKLLKGALSHLLASSQVRSLRYLRAQS